MQAIGIPDITTYEVRKNNQPFDLNTAGVIKIEVDESGQVLSSDTTSVSFSGSTITVDWGDFGLEGVPRYPSFYAYQAGDTEGELLFSLKPNAVRGFGRFAPYPIGFGTYSSLNQVDISESPTIRDFSIQFMSNHFTKERNNKVRIYFDFEGDFNYRGLNNFTDIVINVSDNYRVSLVDDPDVVIVESENTLVLDLKMSSQEIEKGYYFLNIIGTNSKYSEGFVLTSPCSLNLPQPLIVC